MQIKQKFQILANSPTFLDSHTSSSPLFAPIDSLTQLLFETNICPFLPKLYGIYKNVEEIDFTVLPQSFVLKTNHDSGGVVIVPDKEAFLGDSKVFNEAMAKLTKHLNTNFYTLYREYHYKDIEPRIFAEELLGEQVDELNSLANDSHTSQSHLNFKKNENHNFHKSLLQNLAQNNTQDSRDSLPFKVPDDYKINQYFEQTFFIEVDSNRFCSNHTRAMFDENFHKLPFQYSAAKLSITKNVKTPQNLSTLLKVSKTLAKPLGYVRVDLYSIDDRVYVGELTFNPAAGSSRFYPSQYDRIYGDLWEL